MGVIACTADSNWSTWSTSLGLTLKGEMTAASLEKIKEEAFIADPTSYDIPAVSLVMLDECSCIRHVMTTSLEPEDAVEAALNAAKTMNTCRLPDPESLRKTPEKEPSAGRSLMHSRGSLSMTWPSTLSRGRSPSWESQNCRHRFISILAKCWKFSPHCDQYMWGYRSESAGTRGKTHLAAAYIYDLVL